MRAFLRGRASQVLLWGALVVTALSSRAAVVIDAQEPAMRWDGLIELISGRHDYPPPTSTPPNPADGPSELTRHAVSGDGRYIVFTADAPVLGFYGPAVYIRDRRLGETRLLVGGTVNPGSALRDAVISADGRHVAFTFCDPYIRPDQAPICDIWATDTLTYGWTPLSRGLSGEFGNGHSDQPVLSSTGRFVVFRTAATNLVSGPLPTAAQLVIRDRDRDGNGIFDEPGTERIEYVSTPDGRAAWYSGNGPSETAEVSSDGRYVAFRSSATDLVHDDTNNGWDVFWRDRQAHETRRVNIRPYPSGSNESPVSIDSPAISMTPDGRYIAFASADPLLAPAAIDDTNNVSDVFVYDAVNQTTQRLDIGYGPPVAVGQVPGNGATEWPMLSDDGRYVSVQSAATNVEVPPSANTTHSYVIDRWTGAATRVSRKPDGTEPDRDSVKPVISADGSLVAFVSQAFNLTPNVVTEFDRVYAAVYFEITPAEQTVPGGGGSATYDVVTQQHTLWWVDWTNWQPWISFESAPMGTGSGTVTVKASEPNPDATRRSATIRIFEKEVIFTQLEGLSLTSVSPASGPDTGGTQVTIRGTGFEPGMRVIFGSADATAVEFVDSTTLIATSPAHAPETVFVAVMAAPPDYRSAWIDAAFRFTDTTPPQLWSGFSEYPNDEGWFRSDVTLSWAWWDPESPITTMSGCEMTTIATDTPGTTYTCTATSEGGTASLSTTVKRDATAPTATITSPTFALYDLGDVVQPAFTCSDALSGVASCQGSTNGEPVDTSTPGYHTFGVSIMDRAGNPGYVSLDYAVGSGVCTPGLPDNLGWWRMEGNTLNTRSNGTYPATRVGLTSDVYVDAVVGQGYQFAGTNGYLQTPFGYNFLGGIRKWGMAAWVKPSANTQGTIVRRREGYSLARLANGSIAWAFRKVNFSGLSYYDTGVKLPLNVWSHVVVVLDNTVVKTYLNGRLAHTATDIGTVYATESYAVTIGGADDRPDYFKGVLDEVQLFQNGLNDQQVEELFLSGNAGACVPKRTSFEIVEPIPASFGSPTYAFDVRLVDEDGMPVVGRSIELFSQVGAWPYSTSTVNRVTDNDGRVHWDAPLKNAPRGLYEEFAGVTFSGDPEYVRQYTEPDVLVGKGNPVITWPAPAPITYSFPVNSTQLNATASVPGTFSYSPPSGTLLPAGERTLSVTFTPTNTTDYNSVTATNTITVNKATPNVVIEAITPWMYTGTAPTVVGKVKDRFNNVIATPTLTYDGSPDPPTMPGSYTVLASFAGNANYEAGSATLTLTITKTIVDIQIFAQDVTYDGLPHGAGYLVSGLYPDFPPADSVTYNGVENTPVNVGTYTVVVTFNGSDIYEPATATKRFTIHKATPTVTVTGGTFTYDGAAHPATGTVTRNGVSLGSPVLTYNGASDPPVSGGTYNVVGTFAGDENHNPASGSATITIDKTVPVVTVTGGTYTYDGQPHPATASATGVNGVQLSGLTVTYNGSTEPPVNANGYVVTAEYPGDANYIPITRYSSIQIAPATPTVTVTGGTFTYDGQPHGASAIVTGVGGAELAGAMLTYDGSADVPVNAGTYVAVAVFDGSGNYGYAAGSALVTIQKATVVLGWNRPAAIVYGTGLSGDQLNATANAFGSFDYTPAAGTVLNAGASQTLTATFSPADPANYTGGTVTTTIDVSKALASVTANGGTFTYNGQAHPATGFVTGVNGTPLGTPTFTYNGGAQPPVTVGTYDVIATYAGSTNYAPASATTAIGIVPATPVLNWSQPQAVVYGTALGAAQLNATASVPGTFTYSPAPGTVLNVGLSQLLTATFTPADPNYQSGGVVNTVIDVSKATPVLNWAPPAAIAYGTALGSSQLNATSNVPGTFTYSPAAGTVLNAGDSQVLTATFTPTDAANYNSGSVTATIDVSKRAPVLSWASPAAIVHGTALGSSQLNATANVPGTFSYSPAAGTVLNAGSSQTLTATFTPADPANYSAGSVTVTIDVGKATATVHVTGGTFAYDGAPHAATGSITGANGVSLGDPSFTYNGSPESPVNAGSYAVVASFPGNANYWPGSATTTITIGKATAVLGWNQPAAIVYGTPLGAAQLNASSSVPGTFVYSPAAGAVLGAGSHQLTATFTPADPANYTGGSVNTSIAVAAAPLSIRANDVAKPFGAPLPVFTASAAGFVNGDTFASLTGALAFATSATAQSAVGTYAVTPTGLSSSNYIITFVTGALSVVRGGVTVAVSTNPAPSGLNQAMTFTANVGAAAPAAGTPSGTVRFFDGATLLGSSTLSAGSASFSTAGLAAGVHSIQATYDGDGSFLTGTGSASHTVNGAASTPTITIASSRNPSSVGQSVTLTATLTMSAGPVSGTVQFYDGEALVGTSAIVAGSATFATTAFAAGSHAITVRYLGSGSAPPVISGVFVQAVGSSGWKNRTSSATLSAAPNPSLLGTAVTLTANLSGSNGTPAGAVLFMVNGEVAGGPVTLTAISGSTARATFVLSNLPGGRHTVSATYLGSSNYKGSTATVAQTVN